MDITKSENCTMSQNLGSSAVRTLGGEKPRHSLMMSYFVRLLDDVKTSYSARQKGALQAALLLLASFLSAQG